MIIWSGHGILIALFGILGGVVGSMVGAFVANLLGKAESQGIVVPFTMGTAWLGVFLYSRAIAKTKTEVYVDPATGRQVVHKHKNVNTLFFIPPRGWTWIVGIIAVQMSVGAWFTSGDDRPDYVGQAGGGTGTKLLKAAEAQVGNSNGTPYHGNTPEALQLAEGLNNSLQATMKSTSSVRFRTYCQISSYGIAYLVEVPSLRKYNKDSKEFLTRAARAYAVAVSNTAKVRPERVAVAVRGMILYESIEIIKMPAPGASPDGVPEYLNSGKDSEILLPFFDPPTPLSAPGAPGVVAAATPAPVATDAAAEAPKTEASAAPEATPAPVPAVAPAPAPAPPAPAPAPPAPAPVTTEAQTLPTPMKTWKSADGRPLEASLVRFLPGEPLSGEFKRQDGTVHSIAITMFSEEDQKLLRGMAAKAVQ